jgi:hypothetical protein
VRNPEPNQILDARYRLIRVIGSGSFGTVWCAEHLTLSSLVALKVLETVSLAGKERQRFIREAQAAAALRSPHVVQILDCGMDDEMPYIVMELLEGESLEARLERVGRLTVPETERIIRHVARAVQRAHEAGIIHRDLKPGNVFIQANDGDELAKVLDFGIAKLENLTANRSMLGITPAGMLLGTPQYMSPEQILGEQELDGRTDIWSLGVMAYECLIGRAPFDGESLTAVLSAVIAESQPVPSKNGPVPDGFDEWFARACARDPSCRYTTAKQAAEALAAVCGADGSVFGGSPGTLAALKIVGAGTLTGGATAPANEENEGANRPASHARGRTLSGYRSLVGLLVVAAASGLWVIHVSRSNADTARRSERESGAVEARVKMQVAVERSNGATASSATARTGDGPALGSIDSDRNSDEKRTSRLGEGSGSTSESLKPAPPETQVSPAATPSADASSSRAQRPKRTATAVPRATQLRSECDPPWSFDERGQPRAKPACL